METITGIISVVLKYDDAKGSIFASAEVEGPRGLQSIVLSGKTRSLKAGDAFRAEGILSDNPRGGKKFTARMLRADLPVSEDGALRWLKGVFKPAQHGIQAVDIQRLMSSRGVDVLEQALSNPEILVSLCSDPLRFRGAILRDWEARTSARRAVSVMEESGLPDDIVDKVLRAFPDDVYKQITQDPFVVAPLPDVGFANADKLGKRMGMSPSDSKRLEAAAAEVLRAVESNGSTAARLDLFLGALVDTCSMSREALQEFVLKASKHGGHFKIFRMDPTKDDLSGVGICTLKSWNSENRIARSIAARLKDGPRIPLAKVEAAVQALKSDQRFSRFDAVQCLAVAMAAYEPFSVLTGGPGTGKSTVMEAVAYLHAHLGSKGKLFLTAPTNMAAERLNETTKMETSTLQSLLGQKRPERAGMPNTYAFNRTNPLPEFCTVAVDEASMLDVELMAALMDALPSNGRVLLVGDKNQLPSVGAGNMLADLLATRVAGKLAIPSVGLVKVYRQGEDSGIAHGAALMRDGKTPEVHSYEKDGVSFSSCSDDEMAERIEELVCDDLRDKQKVDVMRDIAVLLPQAPGMAGIHAVNRRLSQRLNPTGATIAGVVQNAEERRKGVPLPRVGDRIMITEPDKVKNLKGEDVKISNGELGIITGVVQRGESTHMCIRTNKGKEFLLPSYFWRTHMSLSYALTVHKSQGSQYKHVIMGFAEEHRHMMERALVYTGWTRTQSRWHGFGSLAMFDLAVRTWKGSSRLTTLPLAITSLGAEGFDTGGRPDWEAKSAKAAETLKPTAISPAFAAVPMNKPSKPSSLPPAMNGNKLPPFMLKAKSAMAAATGIGVMASVSADAPRAATPSRFLNSQRRLGSLGRPIPVVQAPAYAYEEEADDTYEP